MNRTITGYFLVSLVGALVACGSADNTDPTLHQSIQASRLTNSLRSPQGRGSYRDQMRALAQQAPGFTGVFFDENGDLTVSVARDDFAPASLATVLAWVRSYSIVASFKSTVKLKRVRYSYADVSEKYAVLGQTMRPEDGVTLTAIDGSQGVIRIGVSSNTKVASLRSRLDSAGVPDDMLTFEEDQIGVGDQTLQSSGVRPAVGGLEIVSHEQTQCSLGFNVMRWDTGTDPATSPEYFLTAAHCAGSTWGQNRSLPYSQDSSGFQVGSEYEAVPIVNYPAWQCPDAGHSPCELADVLVIAYDDTVSVAYGNVAKVSGLSIIGYYNVQGTVTGAIQGQVVTKVGAFGGMSTGTVGTECTDQRVSTMEHPDPVWIMCQDQVQYSADPGDSGGPVFIPYDPNHPTQTPAIVGIHSNHDANNSHRYYSPINQIDFALNNAYFHQ